MKFARICFTAMAMVAMVFGSGCTSISYKEVEVVSLKTGNGTSFREVVEKPGVTPTRQWIGRICPDNDPSKTECRVFYFEGVSSRRLENVYQLVDKDATELAPGCNGRSIPHFFYNEKLARAVHILPNQYVDENELVMSYGEERGLEHLYEVLLPWKWPQIVHGNQFEQINRGDPGTWENEKDKGAGKVNLPFFVVGSRQYKIFKKYGWGDISDNEAAMHVVTHSAVQRWLDGGGNDPWPPAPVKKPSAEPKVEAKKSTGS